MDKEECKLCQDPDGFQNGADFKDFNGDINHCNCTMKEVKKGMKETCRLQSHLEQLHKELTEGIGTLEAKTIWILSKINSMPNSNEATTKLTSYQDSLKKTSSYLKGLNLQPFPDLKELNLIPPPGEKVTLSKVNHPLEVEEVTVGDTFLAKNEPFEEKEDNPADYEDLIEAEVKVELPQISHELRNGRTIFTGGGSEVIVAEPGTIARPLSTENTQEVQLVDLEDETTSKRKRTEDVVPDHLPKKKKEQVPNSETDTEVLSGISSNLLFAVETLSLRDLAALLERSEVKKIIKESISTKISVKTDSRKYNLYKTVCDLAYNCVKFTLNCSQNVILKKMEVIRHLAACNKDLIGAQNVKNYVTCPLLAPGVHVDLLLQLLSHGADPLATSKWNENLFHIFGELLSSPYFLPTPELFTGYVKVMEKIQNDVLRELITSKERIHGRTPLLKIFTQQGKVIPLDFLEAFAKAGADFSANDPSGDSLLSLALEHGYAIEVVKKIIELGGYIHWRDEDGASLLHLAASNGNLLAVGLFLESGLSANIEDNEGLTPLDYLLFKWKAWHLQDWKENYIKIGKNLKECRGKFHTETEGQSLLHVVAADSTLSYEFAGLNVRLLIILGHNNVNEEDSNGDTPLHLACRAFEAQWKRYNPIKRDFTKVKYNLEEGLMAIKYLIMWGAKGVKNKNGETPEDVINQLEVPKRVKNKIQKCLGKKIRS